MSVVSNSLHSKLRLLQSPEYFATQRLHQSKQRFLEIILLLLIPVRSPVENSIQILLQPPRWSLHSQAHLSFTSHHLTSLPSQSSTHQPQWKNPLTSPSPCGATSLQTRSPSTRQPPPPPASSSSALASPASQPPRPSSTKATTSPSSPPPGLARRPASC